MCAWQWPSVGARLREPRAVATNEGIVGILAFRLKESEMSEQKIITASLEERGF
jgi:hypothetical protein